MKKIQAVYKPQGWTPLQSINKFREKFPEYKNEKIGFAGRLDPLAHGVLLLMIGEETTKQKDTFLNLSKEYTFEVLFGAATDTYDALGLLEKQFVLGHPGDATTSIGYQKILSLRSRMTKQINQFIKAKLGKQKQTYPPFSSKTVNGKPLYWWTRTNKLSEIKIPERAIEIYDFKLLGINELSPAKLKKEILKQITSVNGDFRQKEIKEKWKLFFKINSKTNFMTAQCNISCSSGTYIRSLTHELGKQLKSGAITLDILRTKVGEYDLLKKGKDSVLQLIDETEIADSVYNSNVIENSTLTLRETEISSF
ncbi:MAG TPA: hypothetical protein VE090_01450 [Methylomirabilota bacterium]|nr:hypothetical protein [Methylomirabilota bacterium]